MALIKIGDNPVVRGCPFKSIKCSVAGLAFPARCVSVSC